jgi:hypothetical protein
MSEPEITYYATLAAGGTREDPSGIARRTHTTPMPTDEAQAIIDRWRAKWTQEDAKNPGRTPIRRSC